MCEQATEFEQLTVGWEQHTFRFFSEAKYFHFGVRWLGNLIYIFYSISNRKCWVNYGSVPQFLYVTPPHLGSLTKRRRLRTCCRWWLGPSDPERKMPVESSNIIQIIQQTRHRPYKTPKKRPQSPHLNLNLLIVISVGEHFIASPPSPSNNTRPSSGEFNQASR